MCIIKYAQKEKLSFYTKNLTINPFQIIYTCTTTGNVCSWPNTFFKNTLGLVLFWSLSEFLGLEPSFPNYLLIIYDHLSKYGWLLEKKCNARPLMYYIIQKVYIKTKTKKPFLKACSNTKNKKVIQEEKFSL